MMMMVFDRGEGVERGMKSMQNCKRASCHRFLSWVDLSLICHLMGNSRQVTETL